jgi:hypothetical protein
MQANPTQQGTPSKQLAASALWLLEHERFASAYWKLIDLRIKEMRKARPSKATEQALFDGACASLSELRNAANIIRERGGLLFVGAATALRAAAEQCGEAAA